MLRVNRNSFWLFRGFVLEQLIKMPAFPIACMLSIQAQAQDSVDLQPTSQFSRLGYILYGQRVAANGNVVIARASPGFEDGCQSFDGGNWLDAYRHSTTWTNEAALFPVNGPSSPNETCDYDDFGGGLALSPTGQSVIVGAPLHDELGIDAGAAFVYRALNGSWYQSGQLYAPVVGGARFGFSVAMGGLPIRVAVGAPASRLKDLPGVVYTYYSGCEGGFCLESVIESPSFHVAAEFGSALAIDGNTLFVGAPSDCIGGDSFCDGAVYVYEHHPESPPDDRWVLTQTLESDPVELSANGFGSALALSSNGNVLVVGAPEQRNQDQRAQGMVYLFERRGGEWVSSQKLAAPEILSTTIPVTFGQAVAMSDQLLVVGSNWTPTESDGRGSAHLYRYDGSEYVRVQVVASEQKSALDKIGESVAALGDTAMIGAPSDGGVSGLPGAVILIRSPHIADADGDDDADLNDYSAMADCLRGPGTPQLPESKCEVFDFDRDGSIDLKDAAIVQRAIRPPE